MVIYIHIPFCVKKCDYCDFLSAPCDVGTREQYVKCIIRELEHYSKMYGNKGRDVIVTSVFFGGGTPSLLETSQIMSIMKTLHSNYNIEENAEITMECNPGTLTESKLLGYREAGINRLSIGLQSANDEELSSIGRIHTFEQFLAGYGMARQCGFHNINVDLMSALPGQTLASYKETIEKVLAVKPQHVSAYSLILEEGTPLFERTKVLESEGKPTGLPDEDTEREMYYMTERLLGEAGYKRYEISNYAIEGYECKHNTAYWVRDDYLGVGIGAASCMDNVRTKNICDINQYIEIFGDKGTNDEKNIKNNCVTSGACQVSSGAIDSVETDVLTTGDIMAEFMFLGLRMMKGISKKRFEYEFGIPYNDIYGDITEKLIGEGLLETSMDKDRLWLTPLGIDVSNMVLAQFIE